MKRLRGLLVAALAAAGLGACSNVMSASDYLNTHDGAWNFPDDYVEASRKVAEAADWSKARTVDITMEAEDFEPQMLVLQSGKPYVIRVTNVDEEHVHSLGGSAPFVAMAVRKLTRGDTEVAYPRISSFAVKPGETRELHVVPTTPGVYTYKDGNGAFDFPWIGQMGNSEGDWTGLMGQIAID